MKSTDSSTNSFFVAKDISVCQEISIKDRVKILLLAKGINQSKLSEEIGITRQTLNKIINGDWEPTSRIKILIARELGVDSLVIFGASGYWRDYNSKIKYPKKEVEK